MSARRCPVCGGLVGRDAEWCGQCLTRLDEPEAPTRPAPTAEEAPTTHPEPSSQAISPAPPRANGDARPVDGTSGAGRHAVRSGEDGIVWDCPTCGEVNPIERGTCSVCGTAFARLFQPVEEGPQVDPGRAATMSLLFPGLGHYVAGRRADGVARGVVFVFALTTGLLTLFAGRAGSAIFLAVMVVSFAAAAALYVLSTLDAGRAAQGISPIVTTRVLLYGAVGLMLLTLILLTVATFQASPRS